MVRMLSSNNNAFIPIQPQELCSCSAWEQSKRFTASNRLPPREWCLCTDITEKPHTNSTGDVYLNFWTLQWEYNQSAPLFHIYNAGMLFIVPASFQHTSHRAGWFNALPQSIPKSYSSALYKQRVEMLMVSLLQDQLLLHFVQGWIICFFKEWGDQSLKEFTPNYFYSPCGSKPVGVSFLCWTQNKIFWRTKQLLVTTDSRERNAMEVNGVIASIFQNIFFCVQHKKETHTGLERPEGE